MVEEGGRGWGGTEVCLADQACRKSEASPPPSPPQVTRTDENPVDKPKTACRWRQGEVEARSQIYDPGTEDKIRPHERGGDSPLRPQR